MSKGAKTLYSVAGRHFGDEHGLWGTRRLMKIADWAGTSKPALTRRLKSRLVLQEVRLRGLEP
jgi:hypothetical protein